MSAIDGCLKLEFQWEETRDLQAKDGISVNVAWFLNGSLSLSRSETFDWVLDFVTFKNLIKIVCVCTCEIM